MSNLTMSYEHFLQSPETMFDEIMKRGTQGFINYPEKGGKFILLYVREHEICNLMASEKKL